MSGTIGVWRVPSNQSLLWGICVKEAETTLIKRLVYKLHLMTRGSQEIRKIVFLLTTIWSRKTCSIVLFVNRFWTIMLILYMDKLLHQSVNKDCWPYLPEHTSITSYDFTMFVYALLTAVHMFCSIKHQTTACSTMHIYQREVNIRCTTFYFPLYIMTERRILPYKILEKPSIKHTSSL